MRQFCQFEVCCKEEWRCDEKYIRVNCMQPLEVGALRCVPINSVSGSVTVIPVSLSSRLGVEGSFEEQWGCINKVCKEVVGYTCIAN